MKKIILSVVAVAAIAVGYQKYTQAQTMSDLMLANVEALASGESAEDFYEKTRCRPQCDPYSVCLSPVDGNRYNTFALTRCSCGQH